jgi:hypothetical protein
MDDSGNAGETPKKTKPLIPRIPEEDVEVVNDDHPGAASPHPSPRSSTIASF